MAIPTTQPGIPGERWGGFIFVDPDDPPEYTRIPRAVGAIPGEESIPGDFPGTKVVGSPKDLVTIVDPENLVEPSFVPEGYTLTGAYVVRLDSGEVVDYAISYHRADGSGRSPVPDVFSPDLWITWTLRASRPLLIDLVTKDADLGRIGHQREKIEVRGYEAVYQLWENPEGLYPSQVIQSGLNWFDDDGRLWAILADEPLSVLFKVAESLTTVVESVPQ